MFALPSRFSKSEHLRDTHGIGSGNVGTPRRAVSSVAVEQMLAIAMLLFQLFRLFRLLVIPADHAEHLSKSAPRDGSARVSAARRHRAPPP
jgi:hypothetical protein